MIQPHTLQFLNDLAQHNTKDWFDENRKRYDLAKQNVIEAVDGIIQGIMAFDPSLQDIKAKQTLFRINRDVRFSKNKDPYKINFGASISRGGRKSDFAGYYLQIQPGQSFLGGGFYMPPAPILKRIRHQIDLEHERYREVLADPTFQATFEVMHSDALKTAPKGYPKDHPAIDLLRMKSFVVSAPLTDEALQAPDFVEKAVATCQVMYPFLNFLNDGISREDDTQDIQDPLGLKGRI